MKHVLMLRNRRRLAHDIRGVLTDRLRLSGENGLVHLKSMAFYEPCVCRNPVARAQNDDIARDEIDRIDLFGTSIPEHSRPGRRQPAQGLKSPFRPEFLHKPEDRIEDDYCKYGHNVPVLTQKSRYGRCPQKDEDHEVLELTEKDDQGRLAPSGPDQVRPVGASPRSSLPKRQAKRGRGPKLPFHYARAYRVPGAQI